MSLNLFYDLPGDIQHIIHKKVYSMEVMEQLKNIQGNFSWVFDNTVSGYEDESIQEIKLCYKVFKEIGPEAWEYLKINPWFSENIDKTSPIYKRIALGLKKYNITNGRVGMCHMYLISRAGWARYTQYIQN